MTKVPLPSDHVTSIVKAYPSRPRAVTRGGAWHDMRPVNMAARQMWHRLWDHRQLMFPCGGGPPAPAGRAAGDSRLVTGTFRPEQVSDTLCLERFSTTHRFKRHDGEVVRAGQLRNNVTSVGSDVTRKG